MDEYVKKLCGLQTASIITALFLAVINLYSQAMNVYTPLVLLALFTAGLIGGFVLKSNTGAKTKTSKSQKQNKKNSISLFGKKQKKTVKEQPEDDNFDDEEYDEDDDEEEDEYSYADEDEDR